MNAHEMTSFIKEEALKLGFDACGIAKAEEISNEHREAIEQWLKNGYQGEMSYMERNQKKRLNPALLVDEAVSVIVVAFNYYHKSAQNRTFPKIAQFACNNDYHPVIRNKLYDLLQKIKDQGLKVKGRAFSDSAPVAERYWATQAGIGWIGKSHHLIVPGKGSNFLLGELILDFELAYDQPFRERCGNCNRCISACPGGALSAAQGLNSNLCLSYLTIEKRGKFSEEESALCGKNGYLFGCDICQDVCPWNRFRKEQENPDLQPVQEILSAEWDELENMTKEYFKKKFENTCLSRSGLEGLQRNLEAIKKSN
jgi:epoxyqueuosine reductase